MQLLLHIWDSLFDPLLKHWYTFPQLDQAIEFPPTQVTNQLSLTEITSQISTTTGECPQLPKCLFITCLSLYFYWRFYLEIFLSWNCPNYGTILQSPYGTDVCLHLPFLYHILFLTACCTFFYLLICLAQIGPAHISWSHISIHAWCTHATTSAHYQTQPFYYYIPTVCAKQMNTTVQYILLHL